MLSKIKSLKRPQIILLIFIIWFIASILVLLFIPAARKGPLGFGPPAPMTTFRASDGSFSITYPQNWTAINTPQGNHGDNEVVAMIIVAGKQMANVIIAREVFANGNTSDVLAWGQSRAEQWTRHESISLKPTSYKGYNGFINDYSWETMGTFGNVTGRCQDAYLLIKDIGYDLSFCSEEKDWLSLNVFYTKMLEDFTVERAYK